MVVFGGSALMVQAGGRLVIGEPGGIPGLVWNRNTLLSISMDSLFGWQFQQPEGSLPQ